MKNNMKKYPLLAGLIISFIVVVSSIFVLAFCGMRLGTSLGGGSYLEVAISDDADTQTCIQNIKTTIKSKGYTIDACTIEDKVLEDGEHTEFTQRYIVVKMLATNVSDEKELEIRQVLASKLDVSIDKISGIDNIVSSIKSDDILKLGLGFGAIALCLFIFGFVRYDVFAGLSFLLANLHNLILFLAIIIITRIPLSLISIAAIVIMLLVMSAVMISTFEKYKADSELHLGEKELPSVRMIRVQKIAVKPYILLAVIVCLISVFMFFIPLASVLFSALSVISALVVSTYTALLIGPAVYSAFLDIKYDNFQASLSRNDTINKVIKKKIAKAKKQAK